MLELTDTRHQMTQAVELLADITRAFTAAFFWRRSGEAGLRPVVWHTIGGSFKHDAIVLPGQGLVGLALKQAEVVDVAQREMDSESKLLSEASGIYSADEGIKALLAIPVGADGLLVVDIKERPVFGEREKKVVKKFGAFFGNMIEQSNTCCREAMYGRILDLLYDIENASLGFSDQRDYYRLVLDAGRRYCGLSMGMLCLLHPGRRQFTVEAVDGPGLSTLRGRSFPVTQGLVGWVLREAKPLCHNRLRPLKGKSYLVSPDELARGYNAFLGVPLLAWRKLVGVWAFAGNTVGTADEEELRALQLAGHRVASTMERWGFMQS